MTKYRVYVRDVAQAAFIVEAAGEIDAMHKVDRAIIDGTTGNLTFIPLTESEWETNGLVERED
jgi:hypothetical protein